MIPDDEVPPDADESEAYVPEPVGLGIGECIILDPADFELRFNAAVVQLTDGGLFYLDKDSRLWVNVEARPTRPKIRGVE